MRRIDIRQHDKSDCAAACIASVAAYYGHTIPLTLIREVSGTDSNGTSVKGIIDGCTHLGFHAKAYKSPDKNLEALRRNDSPAILHTINSYGDLHFVVLYKMGIRKATIMDPADGRRHNIKIENLRKEWSGYLVMAVPDREKSISSKGGNSRLKIYYSIALHVKSDLGFSLVGAAVYIVTGICTALFLQHIIDVVLPSGNRHTLASVSLLMVIIMGCATVIGYCYNIFAARAAVRIDSRLILTYLRHLLVLPAGFFTRRGAGELNSRISDAMKVRNFLTQGMMGIFTSILLLVGSFLLMFTYYWKMALLTLLFVPAYAVLYSIADRVNRKMNRRIIESAASFEEKSVECISNIVSIRHFGDSDRSYRKLRSRYATLCSNMYAGGRNSAIFGTSSDAISKILTVTLLTAGSLFIFRGEMTVGVLVSFYSLIACFSSPLRELVSINELLTESNIALERLLDIIDLEGETDGEFEAGEECGEISFRDVSFSYPGTEPVIKNFNLVIPKGKITAIQGESGCGKSSLAALLMRDFRPTRGKILSGSTDIGLFKLEQWRRLVSIVPQDSSLIEGTILENITGAESDPDIERVTELLVSLGLMQFVSDLPMGMLTHTGERGCRLSGGQKQRIALARALYRNPSLLILDEATSSLDRESEQIILDKVKNLRNDGKTVIMITHKDENVSIADYRVTMPSPRRLTLQMPDKVTPPRSATDTDTDTD